MTFNDSGLTFIVKYTQDDTQFVKNKLNINISGHGEIEIDRRFEDVVSFRLKDFEQGNFDELDKFVKLSIKLYRKSKSV